MVNLDAFKSPRRLRIEKKRRHEERSKEKQEIERLNKIFSDRSKKKQYLYRVEKTPSFQKDFMKMKEMFKHPDPLFNDDLNLFKKKPKKSNKDDFFNLEV